MLQCSVSVERKKLRIGSDLTIRYIWYRNAVPSVLVSARKFTFIYIHGTGKKQFSDEMFFNI